MVNLIINSPRPFTRPGRFDSVTSPLTYDPAGITTFPSIITGKTVSKYTGSPGRALRVEIPLCSTRGMCVPEGTSICGTFAGAGAGAADAGAADGGAVGAGCGAAEAGGAGLGV